MMMRLLVTTLFLLAFCTVASAQDGRRNTRERIDTIKSSVIIDDIRRPAVKSQTGMIKLIKDDFNFKSVFGTPDVLKTIQMLPGVAQGTEMKSDMYVRGGTGSDNLYLLDNVPVYQVGHLLGMFSVFNTEILSTVDFYKSGFPAKFGGRTSSVVDVGIKEGDFHKTTGVFSDGVTDGRFQIEGPIKKGRSSYNLAFRHGWVEAVMRPLLTKFNVDGAYLSNDITKDGHYGFSDLDAKVSWLLGDSDRLTFNTFLSFDYMRLSGKGDKKLGDYKDYDGNSVWGNGIISANWHHKVSPRTNFIATTYITDGVCDIYHRTETSAGPDTWSEKDDNVSNILDFGNKINAETRLKGHNLRYGAAGIFHRYGAFRRSDSRQESGGYVSKDNTEISDNGRNALDLSIYGEDEMRLARWLNVNAGLRCQMYAVTDKVYNFLEPRAAVSFNLSRSTSLKLSYSRMNQPDHLIMSYMMDYPGNFWMPSTVKMKPMRADQYAVELDFRPDRVWYVNAAGFYKGLENVSEYFGSKARFPDQDSWETLFIQGEGRAYGAEVYAELRKGKFDISGSYTLSWSKRRHGILAPEWYPDRFDNRHKICLNASYKANELVNIYLNWNYHSGNRLTLPSYYYSVTGWTGWPDENILQPVPDGVTSPNNYSFPAYHRLDIGIDLKATNKWGNDYLVSFGCYNVYGRKNPMYAEIEESSYGGYGLRLTSVFTAFPTIRYTLFF